MPAIDTWWAHLDRSARLEALRLWQDCRGDLMVRVEGHFFGEQEKEDVADFWHNDYYDYLVNHEVYLFQVPGFHICTRHPAAAAVAGAGVIPADFVCPFQGADCPMRRILSFSPGKSLRLSLRVDDPEG